MKSNIFKRGFVSLIATQFFGAANDNILKGVLVFMLANGIWEGKLGPGGQGYASALFTIPFILLSGYAGRFADRHSKSWVTVWVKIIEIPIAVLGMIGFWIEDLWITLGALMALACQSAFFGPAKYGMIPELVEVRDLSRANGSINMMTNIAVILGTLAAGQIAEAYYPKDGPPPEPMLWLPGIMMIIVAIAGLVSAMNLPRLNPGDKTVKYELNPLGTYISALKEMAGTPLFTVLFAWAYFYLLAGLALLAIPDYEAVLVSYQPKVGPTEVSVLMGVLGVSIGIGCALAGLLSGHAIRPRLIPIGAIGLIFFFCLLGFVPPTLPDLPQYWRILASWISLFILGAGISAGFYIIPLQAMLQRLTPKHELGRFLGTANGLSFAFILVASLLYPLLIVAFSQEHAEKTFAVSAGLMAIGVVFFIWRVKARGFSFDKFE